MRLHTLRIPCLDLEDSQAFYRTLLEQAPAFGGVGAGYIGFVLDNVTILLEPAEPGEFEAGRYLGFSLEVADLRDLYTRLATDVAFTGPPEDQPWGGRMTHVTDASGNVLSIVEVDPGT